MIVSKIQMQPKPGYAVPAKSSPASKSAAPEISALHDKLQEYSFPIDEGRSSIAGFDVKDWLVAEHPIAVDPLLPR